jgi:hypothetical protein
MEGNLMNQGVKEHTFSDKCLLITFIYSNRGWRIWKEHSSEADENHS